jgi:hypothetical protein
MSTRVVVCFKGEQAYLQALANGGWIDCEVDGVSRRTCRHRLTAAELAIDERFPFQRRLWQERLTGTLADLPGRAAEEDV